LFVKPDICFFVGGHKVCKLEHKTTFGLWPYSHPLIVFSGYETTSSYLLHQYVVRINCEQFLVMHCMCVHTPVSSLFKLAHLWSA